MSINPAQLSPAYQPPLSDMSSGSAVSQQSAGQLSAPRRSSVASNSIKHGWLPHCEFPQRKFPAPFQPQAALIGMMRKMLTMLTGMLQQLLGQYQAPVPQPAVPMPVLIPGCRVDHLVGKNVSDVKRMAQQAGIEKISVIGPNVARTAEYQHDRLTLNVDHSGTVTMATWS